MYTRIQIEEIANNFQFQGDFITFELYGSGHINDTLLMSYKLPNLNENKYIMQKINNNVFHDVDVLMDNIEKVTEHLRKKHMNKSVLTIVKTMDNKNIYIDRNKNIWRAYDFVENSITLQQPRYSKDLYQAGVAFGKFHKQLEELPAENIHCTIPDFHNTKKRYETFEQAIENDFYKKAISAKNEIEFLTKRNHYSTILDANNTLNTMKDLKVRVVHNDAKLNNILFSAETGEVLCIIDLDTVMPGLVHYDFGDAIRFGTCTSAEDEKDLSKVGFDIELFKEFACGYINETKGFLTDDEIKLLYAGPLVMTYENAIRFLTDYLNGDTYFKTSRLNHNLDRCKVQIKLISEMEKRQKEMQDIIIKSYNS